MTYIKKFNEFALNEADEVAADPAAAAPVDPAAAPADAAAEGEPAKPEITKMPRPSDILVAGKKFFRELAGHVQYWFKYGRLNKTYKLDSVKPTTAGLTIWAKRMEDEKTTKFSIRIEINVVNNTVAIQKIEDVLVAIHFFNADQKLLKQSEFQLKVVDLSEKRLRNEMTKVKDAIIQKPKSSMDVRKFNRKEPEALEDDIY